MVGYAPVLVPFNMTHISSLTCLCSFFVCFCLPLHFISCLSSFVPRTCSSDDRLARWVELQRTCGRQTKAGGRHPPLSQRRRSLLEKLDFVWYMQDAMWQEKYKLLQEHVRINGFGTKPPSRKPLGRWMRHQKDQYKLLQNGEKCSLTEERLKALRSLGYFL